MTRVLANPLFLVAAVLLLVAAIGMHPLVDGLTSAYEKQPIGIQQPLDEFDHARLASFGPIPENPGLVADGDPEALDMSLQLYRHHSTGPAAGVSDDVLLFVTYYSDARERVDHTPEVCYRLGGATIETVRTVTVPTPGLAPGRTEVSARLVDLSVKNSRRIVLYVLCCNGRFFYDREHVRFAVGWPGDRRIYFSKIEVAANYRDDMDRENAIERCTQLLGESLPVLLEDHFPSKDDLKVPVDGT